MTSKSLFTNFTKNEIKNKFALLICVILTFVMLYPIYLAFQIQEITRRLKLGQIRESTVICGFINAISGSNGMTLVFTVFFATLLGIVTFGYLYSKPQVDLLHSLPINRKKVFLGKYLSGLLIYEIPLMIFTFLGLGMICVAGYGSMPMVKAAFLGVITHTVGFLICYSTAVLAVVLTGNMLTGICGVGCFQLYGLAVLGVVEMILDMNSATYDTYHSDYAERVSRLSPAAAYGKLASYAAFGNDEKFHVADYCPWLLFAVIFFVIITALAYLLYMKRPSEGTGKSMAFPAMKPVIKVLVMTVVVILGVQMFTMITQNSLGWTLVGLIFVAVVMHIIFQLLLEQDGKAIFKGFISSFASMVIVAIVIFGSGVIGSLYDNYSYNPEKIESMSIQISNNMAMDYYQFSQYYDLENKQFIYSDEYGLKFLKISDKEFIKDFMKEIRKDLKDVKTFDENERTDIVCVCYFTTSGEKHYRNYQVNWPRSAHYFEKAVKNQEYYQAMNQANHLNKEDVSQITYLYDIEDGEYSSKKLELSKEEIGVFFDTYNREYNEKNAEELSNSKAVAFLKYTNTSEYDSDDLGYVCVYDSFKETIKLLEAAGVKIERQAMDTSTVKSVEVSYYVESGEGEVVVEYTDVEKIDKILRLADIAPYSQYTNYMNSVENTQYSIVAYGSSKDDGGTAMSFVKKVPEWIVQDIQDNMKNMKRFDELSEEEY